MTINRTGSAIWQGGIKDGKGTISTESGALDGHPYGFAMRFEDVKGTNPEELIGAAHAGCFSMFLSAILTKDGFPPAEIRTTAKVHLGAGPAITLIELETEAVVPNCDEATFLAHADQAKAGCPVSKALSAVPMQLKATLKP